MQMSSEMAQHYIAHKPIIDRDHPVGMGGWQKIFKFDNELGASVIQTPFSFGHEDPLVVEIGVIKFDNENWKLTDTYVIPGEVDCFRLTEVDDILRQIEEL